MRLPSSTACVFGAATLLLASLLQAGQVEEERALWDLFALQQMQPTGSVAVIDACRKAEGQLGGSPLQGVMRCLLGRHLLEAGRLVEAEAAFSNALSTARQPAIVKAADESARRWLTRIDRERLRAALVHAYRREVQYPDTLQALSGLRDVNVPPLQDRWGRPWHYRPTALKHFPDLKGQTYVLESQTLGPLSDLKTALAAPCPAEPPLKALRVMGGGSVQTVQFERPGALKPAPIVLAEGAVDGTTLMAYVGERILVLADGDCWFVISRPGS